MSDNEKAATFIGWDVGQPCDYPLKPISGPDDMFCFECNIPAQDIHYKPAPDMSDPRNYMKAIEAIRIRGYVVSFGGDPEWYKELRPNHRSFSMAIWGYRDNLVHETYDPRTGADDLAGSVIGTLAALYDAEHSK